MFFVIVVHRFHAIKYSTLLSIVLGRVQKKDEGGGRCVSWNGVRGGEYER